MKKNYKKHTNEGKYAIIRLWILYKAFHRRRMPGAVGTRESSLGPKPGVKRGRDERGVSRRMLPGMIRNRGDFPRHSVHHFSAKGGNEFKKDISRPEKQFFSTERHAMYP